ncbi:MAG TPA: hypothetical protein DDW50_04900 [Firmicutes bacterium]|nr:hypothetical protein [Bacillota bacterium]
MPNLILSPSGAGPNVQASDKLSISGPSNFQSGQNSDFKKVLTKAVKAHPKDAKNKIYPLKQENPSDSDNKVGSLQDRKPLSQAQSQPQPAKHSSSQQSDSISTDQPADQKQASLEDTSGKDSESEDKTAPSKTKQNGLDGDTNALISLVPAINTQPPATTQVAQHDSTDGTGNQVRTDASIALDVQTPVSSNATTNIATVGNASGNKGETSPEDPIHDITGGVTFLKQLMNADDTKVSTLALGNAPELSLMQSKGFQEKEILNASSLTSQISGVPNSGTVAAVSTQSPVNQQLLVGSEINATVQNTSSTEIQDKSTETANSKTTEGTSDKLVAIQTPLTGSKADTTFNPANVVLKDTNGAAPLKLDSETSQSAMADKGTQLNNSVPVSQASAANGKGQTLNLPVIQTQLSVSNQTDKSRNDPAMALSVEQPHPSDTSVMATANIGTSEPIKKDDLFAQIVEKAKVSLNHGNGEMEVNLKPDHLGKLHLKISVENQLVTAKFVAESQQVKEIIETNLNQLRRNLQDNGIQVDQLMVSVGQQQNEGSFQNSSHNSGGFNGQHSNPATVNQEITRNSADHQEQSRRSRGETAIDLIA